LAISVVGVLEVEREDEGLYTCTAENQFKSVEASAYVSVSGIGH